jgi:RHS repeat-associated protein
VNGTVTKYHLVGDKVTYETSGSDKIYYTYDPNGKLVSMNLNGTEYYYIHNAQGDIIGLFNGFGTEVVSYKYDTWGKLTSVTGSLASTVGLKNPYRYRGYRYDTETGLYYLQSRYYNPEWGRFINGDAVLGLTGELLSHNLFAYCLNNPVNMVDFNGYIGLSIIDAYAERRLPLPAEVTALNTATKIRKAAENYAIPSAIVGAALTAKSGVTTFSVYTNATGSNYANLVKPFKTLGTVATGVAITGTTLNQGAILLDPTLTQNQKIGLTATNVGFTYTGFKIGGTLAGAVAVGSLALGPAVFLGFGTAAVLYSGQRVVDNKIRTGRWSW